MKNIFVLEHRNPSLIDRGQTHLTNQGFNICNVNTSLGDHIPLLDQNCAGVIIMGGPQSIMQLGSYPFLKAEINFVCEVMEKHIPLLGICLGAQIIAYANGARIFNHPEGYYAFGYYEVTPTAIGCNFIPDKFYVPAANSQGFEVPTNAKLLAKGKLFPNQAYYLGDRIVGLQFHPEVNYKILQFWHEIFSTDGSNPFVQSKATQFKYLKKYDHVIDEWYSRLLDQLFVREGH